MALTYSQLEGLWIQAGGSPSAAPVAAAIALAESGGNPTSHNGNASTGDNSYGLMQINMLGSMGPARRAKFGLSNNTDLFDPLTNMKVAVAMSNNGKNFTPWSTFTNGAFHQFVQGNVPPNMTAGGAGGTNGNSANGGPQTASVLSDTATTVIESIENIGNYLFMGLCVLFGASLMIAGLVFLIKEHASTTTGAVSSVGRTTLDIALARKLAK